MPLTKQSPRANFGSFYSNVSRRVRFRCAYARCVATRPRAVRRAGNEPLLQEVGLVDIANRVGFLTDHGICFRLGKSSHPRATPRYAYMPKKRAALPGTVGPSSRSGPPQNFLLFRESKWPSNRRKTVK